MRAGSHTTTVGGMALFAALHGCGGGSTCGEGTLDDNGTCRVAPAGPTFQSIAVTHLTVNYDETQPVFLGHRLPLALGLTSRSARTLATPERVSVSVSLVETFAGTPTAAQAAALHQCFVGSIDVDLNGAGEEQLFEPVLTIPRECLPAGRDSVTYNFAITVDSGNTALPAEAGRIAHFTEADRAAATSCRSSADPAAAADGCVHQMIVRASPGADVEEAVEPNGHVALFWLDTPTGESPREMMSVEVDRRIYGPDPFELRGADADRLPGAVTQRVRIAPATGTHAGEYRALRVEAEDPAMPPTETRTVERLLPASNNRFEYDLYPTDEVLGLITTGDWRGVDDFVIEACADPSFTEQGEAGGTVVAGAQEGAGPRTARSNDCQRFDVVGVRAHRAQAATANRVDFNHNWNREWGDDRIALRAQVDTVNAALVNAAYTENNAAVTLTSRYLPDITLAQAHAYGGIDLSNFDRTGINFWVDVFGVRAVQYARFVPDSRTLFERDWNLMRRQCKAGRFTVGPVPIIVEGCLQGTVGLSLNVALNRDGAIAARRFPSAGVEGQLAVTVTPYTNVGAAASVALNGGVARAGVEGQITVLDVRAPIVGSANVGLTAPNAQANLNVNWTLELTGLRGRIVAFVDLIGVVVCWKRVLFVNVPYPCGTTWNRQAELSIFSFGADTERFTLINRTTPTLSLSF